MTWSFAAAFIIVGPLLALTQHRAIATRLALRRSRQHLGMLPAWVLSHEAVPAAVSRYVGQQLPQSVEWEIAYGLSRDFSGTIDDPVTASRSLADT